jgi:leader peptidase (prepilin peptidase)/N-methyltransferase
LFGLTLEGLVYFIFISSLLVITFIDIDHKIIPDIVSLPGIPIGLLASFVLPAMTFKSSLVGLLVGGGSLLLVACTYSFITHKEGMGGGDIKLLGMIGAFLGWKGVIFTIFAASLTGTLVGLIVMLQKGKNLKFAIPFGPFLSIGAMSYVFFGEKVIYWYLHSF